ncbi:hypothetical protein FB565_006948 [Actinoplanes lutulentus]|uniref:hypothetical protein n=1 Tax=Actinoplanes lutulentus TaxID=1287878 RepID=UPI0011B93876|nr:hypothetical protein [Actinoplanes lutulentus]MBB2947180.1 hypothetical protein [Actinoplanes lutulentus]
MQITVHEFARRLSALGAKAFAATDVVALAETAGVRISADGHVDAALAQRLLDRAAPASPVTGAQIVEPDWVAPASQAPAAPAIPPVVFSSPGAVDGPAELPPARPRSRTGPPARRPDSRRTGR